MPLTPPPPKFVENRVRAKFVEPKRGALAAEARVHAQSRGGVGRTPSTVVRKQLEDVVQHAFGEGAPHREVPRRLAIGAMAKGGLGFELKLTQARRRRTRQAV